MKKYKIWIDEAGRWPWLWDVVACALCFNTEDKPSKDFLKNINDSKKLSEKKREKLFKELIELSIKNKIFFWVGVVDNYIIDKINIKQANREAMRRALVELLRKIDNELIDSVLIDWNDNYKFNELKKDPIFIIWGDAKILEIGAASIIAKVFRDKLIKTYSELYPNFSLEKHKWYGTKKHRDFLIDKSKVTGIHRLSYKPVKKILEKKEKLLLHICCWPDASIPILDLKDKYDIHCFWYDPNIQPKKEYDKRLRNFKKVCKIEKVKYSVGSYDLKEFLNSIKWLENTPERWKKCSECYDLRLKKTADKAKELWIKYWTTTLNISPHKSLEKIFKIWDKYSIKNNLEFLKIAFRKNKWFERSVEYTKKYKIYRQNYCGCIYSDTFPEKYKLKK
jgi:ribonuclease HII